MSQEPENQENVNETETQPRLIPDQEPAALLKLARDIMAGDVFGSWGVRQANDMRMVFMTIALGAYGKGAPENLAHVYEYVSEAGPRSINGMPMFMSHKEINHSDFEKLVNLITTLTEKEKEEDAELLKEM